MGSSLVVAIAVLRLFAQSAPQAQPPEKKVSIGVRETQMDSPPSVTSAGNPIPSAQSVPAQSGANKPVHGEWVFVPMPVSNEAIGVGVAPIAMYVFPFNKNDKVSPPSVVGGGGFVASSKSWAIGGGGGLFLKEDRIRLAGYMGTGAVNYDLFGVGNDAGDAGRSIKMHQNGLAFFLQSLFKTKGKLYVGPRYSYRRLSAEIDLSESGSTVIQDLIDNGDISPYVGKTFTTAAMGFHVQEDTRDNMFYPKKGVKVDGKFDFFAPYAGSDFTYQTYNLSFNIYAPRGDKNVFAFRASGCGVTGSRVPFYELCQYGAMGDIRGYQTGRFRDRAMWTGEAEYRRIIWKKLGGTVFGGLGQVAPSGREFADNQVLPGGGVGLRYNMTKQRRFNLRVDVAYSKTQWSWSMGLGEAF